MKNNKEHSEKRKRWVKYYFDICETVSSKSKDPSTKVGAVIVGAHGQILSTGFNGFPIGVNDSIIDSKTSERYSDRVKKYLFISHAEENAITLAARSGTALYGSSLFVVPMRPCARCTRLIIQSGVKSVFVKETVSAETLERWKGELAVSNQMFLEAGVEMIILDDLLNIKESFVAK